MMEKNTFDFNRKDLKREAFVKGSINIFKFAEKRPAGEKRAAFAPAERLRRGITDNLVRLSVGIEHVEDLETDLRTALAH